MTILSLQILPTSLLEKYKAGFDKTLFQNFEALKDSELSIENFSFYTSVSAVFSSKIEGENIELDSFIKHKRLVKYQPDYTRKFDDLYNTYHFAQQNNGFFPKSWEPKPGLLNLKDIITNSTKLSDLCNTTTI